jgi:preprotein translocase subunit SecA
VESSISTFCAAEFGEEWDTEGLWAEIASIWPTELSVDDLRQCVSTDELYEKLMGEATAYYESREAELGPETLREIERHMMLRLIDQHWREHLYEMDYLEEGIGLRALGQKDPLVEWQREGFEMFGAMIASITSDYVKHVMHARVVVEAREERPVAEQMRYSAPEDPSSAGPNLAAAARAQAAAEGADGLGGVDAPSVPQPEEAVNVPTVKSEWDKTPRNAPCPCGSGKKFKLCHGA